MVTYELHCIHGWRQSTRPYFSTILNVLPISKWEKDPSLSIHVSNIYIYVYICKLYVYNILYYILYYILYLYGLYIYVLTVYIRFCISSSIPAIHGFFSRLSQQHSATQEASLDSGSTVSRAFQRRPLRDGGRTGRRRSATTGQDNQPMALKMVV